MKFIKVLVFLSVFCMLEAREVIDYTGVCNINWSQGYIVCEGESQENQTRYEAKVAAKVIAQRNLLEVVKGVRIDSYVVVSDGMVSSRIIKTRVEGVISGAQIISNIYDSSTGYAVAKIKLEMGKDLLSALLSDPKKLSWNEKIKDAWHSFNFIPTAQASSSYTTKDISTIKKILKDLREVGNEEATKYVSSILDTIEDVEYSGVLIDISDVEEFKKAMIVRLVDENGREIYPSNVVSKKTLLRKNTSVGYMYGIEDARVNPRVFSKPYEIKAHKVYKNRKSNIVLTHKQIEDIKALDKEILKKAKIILVLGE